ncbi:uncharacterized protein (DUF1800 family) [Asanoa ferruginea]|uniref:Uncharacterized protein (DUF1800 family) n=1 Tax=Asanoa ferruginea TaxID=53367 RepID=A0A3D9ZTP5_9ACTN|nr:DUF1800 family protein [Asanoa ferruginea]REG00290.1 uncharacterized protein (DUF1800 family) [Asanoa ferruginea]GIF52133.1 hypothetical protein Afe04nite_66720 [Asanoa ferruginea]
MSGGVALLLRRAGFGPTAAELAAAKGAGYEATVKALFQPAAPDVGASATPIPSLPRDPYSGLTNPSAQQRARADRAREEQTAQLTRWWLDRLTAADHQAREKLIWFWHGHWATSIRKVIRPTLMLRQHRTLRESEDFRAMAHAMVRDPALIYWLDGQLNDRQAANENLGRELMELFLLGIGSYTERDVKEAGRALTGWKIEYDDVRARLSSTAHDPRRKTILGVSRAFDADSLVDFLLGRDECPRFIAARLWHRYGASEEPIPAATSAAVAAKFPDPAAMLAALFLDDAFQASAGKQVKQPVEWLVGAARQLGLRPGNWDEETLQKVLYSLDRLGQVPFAPPSVGGWPSGGSWLTPGTAQVRVGVADRLASMVQVGALTPESLAGLLGVETWTDRTYTALKGVSDVRRLLTLGLVSPEYLVT